MPLLCVTEKYSFDTDIPFSKEMHQLYEFLLIVLKMLPDFSLRRVRTISVLSIVFFILITFFGVHSLRGSHLGTRTPETPHQAGPILPQLPDYQRLPSESAYCTERFGLDYLRTLSNSSIDYCNAASRSSLTCFRSQTADDGRVDSFCFGTSASTNSAMNHIDLDCQLREWTVEETAKGIRRLDQFPNYWYETGPRYIFNNFIRMKSPGDVVTAPVGAKGDFSILIKREEKVTNLWHSLMEISALFMTLDVLRMTRNPATGLAFFTAEDVQNTQVIILDDHPQGPYYELWSLFAEKPMLRWKDRHTNTPPSLNNIIIPLPGASNPLWQGDWKVQSCDHSKLLRTFSQRTLQFYKVASDPKPADMPLVVTFIDRKEKRRLIDKDLYINKLRLKFPAIEVQMVDFAELSFSEQLKVARQTDLLVGVHGAGLTHGLFQRPGSAMVEIIPNNLAHKGFRNLAKLLGHHYFSSHADKRGTATAKDAWQTDDVYLGEDRFMNLLEVAVKSMYNRGLLNSDVSK